MLRGCSQIYARSTILITARVVPSPRGPRRLTRISLVKSARCLLRCIGSLKAKKPVAGIKNIITDGFCVCAQVNLINFQSMPDGPFKYSLNYLDHGIKRKLTSAPIIAKQVSAIAYALLSIFTNRALHLSCRRITVKRKPQARDDSREITQVQVPQSCIQKTLASVAESIVMYAGVASSPPESTMDDTPLRHQERIV